MLYVLCLCFLRLVLTPSRLNRQKRSTLDDERTIRGHWTYPFNIDASHSLPHRHTHTHLYTCPAPCSENSNDRGEREAREEKKMQENTAQ